MEKKEYLEEAPRGTPQKIAQLKSYIAALLMLVPNMNLQSEDSKNPQDTPVVYEYTYDDRESTNVMSSYEVIFKDGIKRSLEGINIISQIPVGGKKITYYWDSGKLKGKVISSELVKKLGLPEKFDISPRHVGNKLIDCMYFTLGDRVFSITPNIGMIKSITLDSHALVIEITTLFSVINKEIVYDKDEKLPDLMYRLWMTQRGKGKKEGFRATTIKEI